MELSDKRLDSGARLPCRLSHIAQHHWVIRPKDFSRLSFVYCCDGKCGCSADHDTIGLAGCYSKSIAADRLPAINDKMRRLVMRGELLTAVTRGQPTHLYRLTSIASRQSGVQAVPEE